MSEVERLLSTTTVATTLGTVGQTRSQHDLTSFLSASASRFRSRSEVAVQNNVPEERTETDGLPVIPPDTVARRHSGFAARVFQHSTTPGVPTLSIPERTLAQLRAANWHLSAFCFVLFLQGWNDGSTGPLLPKIQDFFDLDYAVISLAFILTAVGFVVGAATIVPLVGCFGMGKIVSCDASLQLVEYAMLVPAGPFPKFAASFTIVGFGICLQGAQANAFIGGLPEDTATKLGLLHGAYGLSAFAAPLASIYFSSQDHWSYHYTINLGLTVINFATLTAVFRLKSTDSVLQDAGYEPIPTDSTSGPGGGQYGTILGIRSVYFLATFVLIYDGVEVTIGAG